MWKSRNKWIIRYWTADKAWFVLTSRGKHIYKRCSNMCQAIEERAAINIDAAMFDEYQDWKKKAGRSCMNFSLQKLAQRRREAERKRHDHFEEF